MKPLTQPAVKPETKSDKSVALIAPQPTKPVSHSRSIPPRLRTQIWQEYGGRCAFVSQETGKRCESTFGLEIEHCKPFGLGGSSHDPRNLRLLCRHHNQWQAIETYGLDKMARHLGK